MKKIKILAVTTFTALIMTSCIGSFKLTNQLLDWNKGVGTKFANEVVFLAFHVIPVYPVCYLADIFVLNSIEFWNGENVLALKNGDVKEIEYNNVAYKISKKRRSCRIEKVGDSSVYADLTFDRKTKSWRVKNDTYDAEIVRFLNHNKIQVTLPDNKSKIFEMNGQGLAEMREFVNNEATTK